MSSRVLIVGTDAALGGSRAAVHPIQGKGPAVLTFAGRRGHSRVGVSLINQDEMPQDVVLVTEDFAARCGLTDECAVTLEHPPARPLAGLSLEALVEEDPMRLWSELRADSTLVGRALWFGDEVGSTTLECSGRIYRVRAVDNHSPNTLRSIDGNTQIELFLPGARAGVDVVVLADVSGSMEVDDLPVDEERVALRTLRFQRRSDPQFQKRSEALKDALRQMVAGRLRVAGVESRMALLAFNTSVAQKFPTSGMVPVDAESPAEVIQSFERAIDSLGHSGGTNINEAVLAAAELLDLHGKVDNEKLIVLVSDGKTWTPRGADAAGEVVNAVDDPVSLVQHLYERRGIRLQAIGISNDYYFNEWVRRQRYSNAETLRPDHPLIQELVKVGGGDPTRIGGMDVLEEYFSHLGAGLSRYLGKPAAAEGARTLSPLSLDVIAERTGFFVGRNVGPAVDRLKRAMLELNAGTRSLALGELGPWMPFKSSDRVTTILDQELRSIEVRGKYEFENVVQRFHVVLVEQGPGRRRPSGSAWPPVLDPIYEALKPVVERVNALRQFYLHDKTGGKAEHQKDLEAAAVATQHYVGRRSIPDGDRTVWSKLAWSVLDDIVLSTERAAELAAEELDRQGRVVDLVPEETPSPRTGDLDVVLDLRVRP